MEPVSTSFTYVKGVGCRIMKCTQLHSGVNKATDCNEIIMR